MKGRMTRNDKSYKKFLEGGKITGKEKKGMSSNSKNLKTIKVA